MIRERKAKQAITKKRKRGTAGSHVIHAVPPVDQ